MQAWGWAVALALLVAPTQALFGWGGGGSDKRKPVESDRYSCLGWKGVDGCHARSQDLEATAGLEKGCRVAIHSRMSGYCECAWGRAPKVDCGHQAFTCQQVCYQEFPAGELADEDRWLEGTAWNWNNWREVQLLENGIFMAPTPDCEEELECFWFASEGLVYIMWGDAGFHSVEVDPTKRVLRGMRFDGDKCQAILVREADKAGGQVAADEEETGDQDLYELMGLDFEATESDIKKAFRKLSRDYHPDRIRSSGVDPERAARMFEKVRSAYDVLGDPDKRILYDTGGMEAVEAYLEHGGRDGERRRGGGDPLSRFFGGGGGHHNPSRGRDAEYTIKVSLDDMYKGGQLKTNIERRVVCRGCRKPTEKNRERCAKCGRCPPEVRMVQRQMGGFLVQQQEQVPSKERCTEEKAELTLTIEKGMDAGERLVFPRMAEQTPGKIPGDIVIEIEMANHHQFQRQGNDLSTTVRVPLRAALTGFHHEFPHLDGHLVTIETDPAARASDIIRPRMRRTIKGEGMPLHQVPSQHGNLKLEFEVLFPSHLTDEQRARLREVLPDA